MGFKIKGLRFPPNKGLFPNFAINESRQFNKWEFAHRITSNYFFPHIVLQDVYNRSVYAISKTYQIDSEAKKKIWFFITNDKNQRMIKSHFLTEVYTKTLKSFTEEEMENIIRETDRSGGYLYSDYENLITEAIMSSKREVMDSVLAKSHEMQEQLMPAILEILKKESIKKG